MEDVVQEPTTQRTNLPFPAEIRTLIYNALFHDTTIHLPLSHNPDPFPPACLRVCKAIRTECTPILLAQTRLLIPTRALWRALHDLEHPTLPLWTARRLTLDITKWGSSSRLPTFLKRFRSLEHLTLRWPQPPPPDALKRRLPPPAWAKEILDPRRSSALYRWCQRRVKELGRFNSARQDLVPLFLAAVRPAGLNVDLRFELGHGQALLADVSLTRGTVQVQGWSVSGPLPGVSDRWFGRWYRKLYRRSFGSS